ncbi:peptidoglycan DD-metalloendopeptidase family protein [Georgenia yuyongxinii]
MAQTLLPRLALLAGLAAALSLAALGTVPTVTGTDTRPSASDRGPAPPGAVTGAAPAEAVDGGAVDAGAAPAVVSLRTVRLTGVGTADPAVSDATGPSAGTGAARLVGDGFNAGEVGYRWPTGDPAEVVRAFDPPGRPWDAGHRGVDLAHGTGAAVLAAADGVVVFAGTVVDRPVVSVDHADGIRTTYEPVTPVVTAGQRVRAGDVLGHLVAGHCFAWQPSCLHWGARRGPDVYVDPLRLVGAQVVVRLLPGDVGPP